MTENQGKGRGSADQAVVDQAVVEMRLPTMP